MTNTYLFFDGECVLCNKAVEWVYIHDYKGVFTFVSLQSNFAKNVLSKYLSTPDLPDSLILMENGQVQLYSSAVIKVALHLKLPFRILAGFLWIVPKPLRDWAYRFLAKRRLRWWGRQDNCFKPPLVDAHRFID